MITAEIKTQIIQALTVAKKQYNSNAKMAVALDINPSQLSRLFNGETESIISDAKWLSLARRLDVQIGVNRELVTAVTPVYEFINAQLSACQGFSISNVLCDIADIGKSYAAKCYVKEHKNAIYIDCSQYKTKQKLVRAIAKEFGLPNMGKYSDLYPDLIYYVRSLPTPLVVLDEAGDLAYDAFLELKALWNATERACGWYMMGADGLKAKIEKNLNLKKVGYAEILSRFGSRFQRITPDGGSERSEFIMYQVAVIGKANGVADIQKLYAKTGGSLRRIYTEIQKSKTEEAAV